MPSSDLVLTHEERMQMKKWFERRPARPVIRRFPAVLSRSEFVLTYEAGDEFFATEKERTESGEHRR